jgi:hypothetical protein
LKKIIFFLSSEKESHAIVIEDVSFIPASEATIFFCSAPYGTRLGLYKTGYGILSVPVRWTYNFTITAPDLDNDTLQYYVDWGDGSATNWTLPTASGQVIAISHKWTKKGTSN